MKRLFKPKKKKESDSKTIRRSLYIIAAVSVVELLWANSGTLTPYGLQMNIADASVPTLVNGITSSISIVIGVLVAILGLMYRYAMDRKDSESKEYYLKAILILLSPVFFLWTTYVFLTQGMLRFAVNYSLSGLILALTACTIIVIVTVMRVLTEPQKEDISVGTDI